METQTPAHTKSTVTTQKDPPIIGIPDNYYKTTSLEYDNEEATCTKTRSQYTRKAEKINLKTCNHQTSQKTKN